MGHDRLTEGGFRDFMGEEVVIPQGSFVKAEDDFLPLCSMCRKSRLSCENTYVRDVEVPLERGEEGEIAQVRQFDGTYRDIRLNTKMVDGVEAGIYKSEQDIPAPIICQWFEKKDFG